MKIMRYVREACIIAPTVWPTMAQGGGPLGFNLNDVVLAELDMPSTTTMNAQLDDLLQSGGERIESAAEYEARDASGSIRVTVDAQRKLTDVDIQRSWVSRIPAAQLAGVLFDTYVKAVQRAMVVALANTSGPAADHRPSDTPVDDVDPKPYDEWITGIRARINDIDAKLEHIRHLETSRATSAETDVRSPLGFFVLHLRGGSPAGLAGSVNALTNAGSDRLRQDFLKVFSAADLAGPGAPLSRRGARLAREPEQAEDEDSFEFRYDI
jgi:hypothetical protein